MKPGEQTLAQLAWFAHHGVDRFDLAVQRATGMWMTQAPALSSAMLQDHLPWCRAENARGGNVYVRAHRHGAWPVVFLDDVALVDAKGLANRHPALVIETSPDRCHVWLYMGVALSEAERFVVQKALAAARGVRGALADAASVSGEHWGRLAGFRNRKPGRDCWVNLQRASRGQPPLPMNAWLADDPGAQAFGKSAMPEAVHERRPVPHAGARATASESEREWGLVLARLERGASPADVEAWLAERARARRGKDAHRYAHLTVRKAYEQVRARFLRW